MFAVVITGPPGAGKTSVLTALADALSDDNVPHAAVEAEALRWAHPAITGEQEMRHLSAMCTLYRQAGHTLILIGQTIEVNDDLTGLLDAAGADQAFVVRLEALPATLVERITRREPEGWSGLAGLLAHAQRLAAIAPGTGTVDLVLSTEGQLPRAVAERIRRALPDHLAASTTRAGALPRPRHRGDPSASRRTR